jgi:hypothetical protein
MTFTEGILNVSFITAFTVFMWWIAGLMGK